MLFKGLAVHSPRYSLSELHGQVYEGLHLEGGGGVDYHQNLNLHAPP